MEKEKDELEGAKEEAVQFLSSENEITKLHNCLYQKYLYVSNKIFEIYCTLQLLLFILCTLTRNFM